MRKIINQLIFSVLLVAVLISCRSASENKKVETVSAAKVSAEMSKNLPLQSTSVNALPGKSVYMKECLTCHQADGSGVPNMHPPLGPGSWVGKDPKELIAIMMKGLSGKIEVNGEAYKNFMPSHAKMSDEEIADVLTYIRSSFGNNFGPVSEEMVSKIRSGR